MSPRERGPDPDYEDEDDIHRLAGLIERLAGGYREAPKVEGWQKWLIGICSALVPLCVVGGVVMYGKMSAMESKQESTKEELNRLRDQQERMQARIEVLITEVRQK